MIHLLDSDVMWFLLSEHGSCSVMYLIIFRSKSPNVMCAQCGLFYLLVYNSYFCVPSCSTAIISIGMFRGHNWSLLVCVTHFVVVQLPWVQKKGQPKWFDDFDTAYNDSGLFYSTCTVVEHVVCLNVRIGQNFIHPHINGRYHYVSPWLLSFLCLIKTWYIILTFVGLLSKYG